MILALVAAGLGIVLLLFRDSVGNAYGKVGNQVDAAGLPVTSPGGGAGGSGGGKGDHGCGGGQGGGYGRGGGGGCGGGQDH